MLHHIAWHQLRPPIPSALQGQGLHSHTTKATIASTAGGKPPIVLQVQACMHAGFNKLGVCVVAVAVGASAG